MGIVAKEGEGALGLVSLARFSLLRGTEVVVAYNYEVDTIHPLKY